MAIVSYGIMDNDQLKHAGSTIRVSRSIYFQRLTDCSIVGITHPGKGHPAKFSTIAWLASKFEVHKT